MKQSQYNQVPSVYGHSNVHGTFIPKKYIYIQQCDRNMTGQLSQFVCGLHRDAAAADKPVDSSDPR